MPFTIGGSYIPSDKDPKKPMRVFLEKRRGRSVTIVKHARGDLKDLSAQLKAELCCGGSVKNDQIELQGDHVLRVKEILKS